MSRTAAAVSAIRSRAASILADLVAWAAAASSSATSARSRADSSPRAEGAADALVALAWLGGLGPLGRLARPGRLGWLDRPGGRRCLGRLHRLGRLAGFRRLCCLGRLGLRCRPGGNRGRRVTCRPGGFVGHSALRRRGSGCKLPRRWGRRRTRPPERPSGRRAWHYARASPLSSSTGPGCRGGPSTRRSGEHTGAGSETGRPGAANAGNGARRS